MTAVTTHLAVSSRTLQRQLRLEGTTFQAVLASTREDLARHYLSHGAMRAAEIAYLLGYDDTNSFYRAFRSWTGTTPETLRATPTTTGGVATAIATPPFTPVRDGIDSNCAALSLVTISVPVSTLASTVSPLAAATAVSMPSEPIFAGNWATEPASSPALMALDLVRARRRSRRRRSPASCRRS